MDGDSWLDLLICPFCRGDLVEDGSYLVCPEGLRFSTSGGIYDLYLPRCDCGGIFKVVSEDQDLCLSCPDCGEEVLVADRMKETQTPTEQRLYVARDKTSVEDEWGQASKGYWTLPMVASETLREDLLQYAVEGCVLDMGTGPGLWLHFLQAVSGEDTRVVAADISQPMLVTALRGIEDPKTLTTSLEFPLDLPDIRDPRSFLEKVLFVRADAERPPFKDNVFDCCLSFQTLQYTNQRTSIAELLRLTKHGGHVIIGTQPGSEACGYLEYDCDLSRVKDPKRREGLRRQFQAFEKFLAWFEEDYPRQAMLFREGWKTFPDDPLDLYLEKERGKITPQIFIAKITEWEEKVNRPLDPTKHSCCYGEKRFTKMINQVAKVHNAKVLEAHTKIIPDRDAQRLDPSRAQRIDHEDSWDWGMYLHFYATRYAALQKT